MASSLVQRKAKLKNFNGESGVLTRGRFQRLVFISGCMALISLSLVSSARASVPVDRNPRAIEKVMPVPPIDLSPHSLRAEAEIVCTISVEGKVLDAAVAEASSAEFGQSALEALRQWRFEPGLRNGTPANYKVRIPFIFNSVYQEKLERFVKRKIFFRLDKPLVPAESLSEWLVSQITSWPRYPKKLKGTGTIGAVIISFVINREGEVINPEIVKSSHPEFTVPALAATVSQRFAPVLDQKGQALAVNMLIQYDFDEKVERRKSKANPLREWDDDGS